MEDLERQVFELEAIARCQWLMGAYSFFLDGRKYDDVVELFSKKMPDVRVEMTNGVYQGREGLIRLYPGCHYAQHTEFINKPIGYRGQGSVGKHSQNTPTVVVAEDGLTAKGTWVSMGFAAGWRKASEPPMFNWGHFRYGADFIYEDGDWKIWHLHVFSGFMATYDHPWSEPRELGPDPNSGFPQEYQPDFPPTTTFDYRPDLVVPNLPEVPTAYALFQPDKAY